MISIKDVPQEFKKDDVVEVKGDLKSGVGKVWAAYFPTLQPTGELAYHWKYEEPFPQIIVLFSDGEKIHYNADDLISGKVAHTTKPFREAKTLFEWFNKIVIDRRKAFDSLGEIADIERDTRHLRQDLTKYKIWEFFKPLLSEKVYCDSEEERVELDEFDVYTFCFTSVVRGKAMRNSNVPAFTLWITVDGYAPTTFRLDVTEVFLWKN